MAVRFRIARPVVRAASLTMLLSLPPLSSSAPLPDVVRQVLESHPDVVSAAALVDAADARIRQSRSAYLPAVGLSYENSRSTEEISGASIDRDVDRLDATLRWNLFRGFADRHAVASASARKAASAAELDAAREALTLRVVEVYLDVLRNESLVAVSAAQIESLEALVARVTTRAEMGRISRVNVHQANTRLVQARNRHFQLRAALEGARLRFREITGLAPEALALPELDETIADQPVASLYRRAIEGNPRVVAARDAARSREADIGVARGELLPTVDLELRKRLSSDVAPESSIDIDSSVRVTVNYAFELGGGSLGRKAEAVSLKVSADARLASLEREIRADLAAVSRQLVEDRNIAPNLEENVDAAKAVVEAYHRQFDAGKRTLLDLLIAHADLYEAEAAVLENRFRRAAMVARIHFQMGQLRRVLLAGEEAATDT